MRMWEILIEAPDFKNRDSGQLALAVHELTGAEMVRVVSQGRVLRVINRINDDAFLDCDGVHSRIEMGDDLKFVPISCQ